MDSHLVSFIRHPETRVLKPLPGALWLQFAGRKVLSLPSQRGCAMGCTFCNSTAPNGAQNLTTDQMLALARTALEQVPHEEEVELSFTGEGEPLLNWKNIRALLGTLGTERRLSSRMSMSGFSASSLLGAFQPPADMPCRLQVSLHAARQHIRNQLMPRSAPVEELKEALLNNQHKFSDVSINVVLQDGLNDTEDDFLALQAWLQPGWRVTFNPLLLAADYRMGSRSAAFAQRLRRMGHFAVCFHAVGQAIAVNNLYPMLASTK